MPGYVPLIAPQEGFTQIFPLFTFVSSKHLRLPLSPLLGQVWGTRPAGQASTSQEPEVPCCVSV